MNTPSTALRHVEPAGFHSLAQLLSRTYGADLLLSDSSPYATGWNYVGIEPIHELVVDDTTSKCDLEAFAFSDDSPTFGFLSYEYGLIHAGLLRSRNSTFPLGHLKKYRAVVNYHASSGRFAIHSEDSALIRAINSAASNMVDEGPEPGDQTSFIGSVTQSISRDEYIERVRQTLDFIRRGHIYQLNLSIKFTVDLCSLPDAGLLWYLFRKFPAAYYAWFRSGRYRILSTSPECFLRVRDSRVQSYPIKGTLRFDTYSDELSRKLTSSPKEDAELSMIVDLIRNDLSQNCEYGSVTVADHKSVFAVDNLLQMYSTVEGRLRPDRTCLDLLVDAFPGGSITGCPKRRAMELIDEFEPHSRDIYCGSLFVIRDRVTLDASIAIRTGYVQDDTSTFTFFAGSGIVVDSNPDAEYVETLAKAEKFLALSAPQTR